LFHPFALSLKEEEYNMNVIFHRKGKALIAFICAIILALIGSGNIVFAAEYTQQSSNIKSNYKISIFARGTGSYFNPDSVEVVGHFVYIDYQNQTAKDGTDNKTSTIT
jgi:hypothetical protein